MQATSRNSVRARAFLLPLLVAALLSSCASNPERIAMSAGTPAQILPSSFTFTDERPETEKRSGTGASTSMEERTLGDDAISPPAALLLERELARQGNQLLSGKQLRLISLVVTANVIAPTVQPAYGAAALGPSGVAIGGALAFGLQWAGTRPKLSVLAGIQVGEKTYGAFHTVQVTFASSPREALESAIQLTARDLVRSLSN